MAKGLTSLKGCVNKSVPLFRKIIGFVVILLTLGFPRFPNTDIPLLLLIAPMYYKQIYAVYKYGRMRSYIFIFILFLFIAFGNMCWIYGAGSSLIDIKFFATITIKIILNCIAGIIIAHEYVKNRISILLWVVLQSFLALSAAMSDSIYFFLIKFISASSAEVFSDIFGLRTVGFGLYHVDGAVIIMLVAIFLINDYIKSSPAKLTIFFVSCVASIAMARSSLIVIGLYLISSAPLFFCVVGGVFYVTAPYLLELVDLGGTGILYEALEPFNNYILYGEFSTKSTNANMNMFVFPDKISDLIWGYGRFFEAPGEFFKNTDLGWIRLLLFGGAPLCLLFLALNTFWVACAWRYARDYKDRYFVILVSTLFIVLNFKGIQYITFLGMFCYVYYRYKNRTPD